MLEVRVAGGSDMGGLVLLAQSRAEDLVRRPGCWEEGEREEAQMEAFLRWVSPEPESTLSVFQHRTAAWG